MAKDKIEIVFHVDESLQDDQLRSVEQTVEGQNGIWEAHFTQGKSHLMRVAYNPSQTTSADILNFVKSQKLHAERIG